MSLIKTSVNLAVLLLCNGLFADITPDLNLQPNTVRMGRLLLAQLVVQEDATRIQLNELQVNIAQLEHNSLALSRKQALLGTLNVQEQQQFQEIQPVLARLKRQQAELKLFILSLAEKNAILRREMPQELPYLSVNDRLFIPPTQTQTPSVQSDLLRDKKISITTNITSGLHIQSH